VAFPDDSSSAAAYARRLPEIRAVKAEDLVTINLDFQNTVTTVIGALPEILALREEIAKLVHVDQTRIDELEDLAMAAAEAEARYVIAHMPAEDIVALNEEGMRLRETFRLDALALSNRGLIAPERLDAFPGLTGYKHVAFDLINWASLMMDCWSTIEGKTALTVDEVRHAKKLGERLMAAAGHREQGPEVFAEVSVIRQQAFTLLIRGYEEVRRAIAFLRWHEDDVDTIAPSLYAGRGGRKRRADEEKPAKAPAAPEKPAEPKPAVEAAEVPVGHMGGSPLLKN
jgi:hypothetical protein